MSACIWLWTASAEKQSAPSTLFLHRTGCFANAAMDVISPCRGNTISRISSPLPRFHRRLGCCVGGPAIDCRYTAVRNTGGGWREENVHRVTWLVILISPNCSQGQTCAALIPDLHGECPRMLPIRREPWNNRATAWPRRPAFSGWTKYLREYRIVEFAHNNAIILGFAGKPPLPDQLLSGEHRCTWRSGLDLPLRPASAHFG